MIRDLIIEQCIGCGKVITEDDIGVCSVYLMPSKQWRIANGQVLKKCSMSTHIKREFKEDRGPKDPLKASKQKAKGR